ncbi:hypothetical protein X777_15569 [Ooceraea biroi]|uniref:Uncharacterized protein n=1 Tax=Ooceraea biroi TaxID=2015173 RepID=A0A026VUL4_OOCBI|nr:hypothetical protein X777_15569 [Ooceraea biroi]
MDAAYVLNSIINRESRELREDGKMDMVRRIEQEKEKEQGKRRELKERDAAGG